MTVRFTKRCRSSSFSSLASTLGVMPGMLFWISVKRSLPASTEIIIGSFHLPLMAPSASRTGITVSMQHVCAFFFDMVFKLTHKLLPFGKVLYKVKQNLLNFAYRFNNRQRTHKILHKHGQYAHGLFNTGTRAHPARQNNKANAKRRCGGGESCRGGQL